MRASMRERERERERENTFALTIILSAISGLLAPAVTTD